MRNKALILGVGIALFAIMFLGLASAALSTITLNLPPSSSVRNGIIGLNVTAANPASNFSCSYYAQSASTANSTWVLLAIKANDTAVTANTTFDTRNTLEDANDYSFNATCRNNTDLWVASVNTGITIDNTVPSTPTSQSPANQNVITAAGTQNYSVTVNAVNTTGCTLNLGLNGGNYIQYAMTHSGSTCSYIDTYSSSSQNGNYYWFVTASDGTNSSSATGSFINQVQVPAGNGGVASGSQYNQLKKQQTLAVGGDDSNSGLGILIIAALIIAGIVYAISRK